jgi:hypothetical protein
VPRMTLVSAFSPNGRTQYRRLIPAATVKPGSMDLEPKKE